MNWFFADFNSFSALQEDLIQLCVYERVIFVFDSALSFPDVREVVDFWQ